MSAPRTGLEHAEQARRFLADAETHLARLGRNPEAYLARLGQDLTPDQLLAAAQAATAIASGHVQLAEHELRLASVTYRPDLYGKTTP